MRYFDEAKDLVEASKENLIAIQADYERSLSEQNVKAALLIKIKNFMENLRSALDYTAHGLFAKYGDRTKSAKNIYFPYAWSGLRLAYFRNQRIIEKKIPGLTSSRPDIVSMLESYQHFSDSNDARNAWLPEFMELNNNNKHQHLTPQKKKEAKQFTINDSMGNGVQFVAPEIRIGDTAQFHIGGTVVHGTEIPSLNSPTQVTVRGVHMRVKIWVSFHFSHNDEAVLPFLENTLRGIETIVTELSQV